MSNPSTFDEEGNLVTAGDKFDAPPAELLKWNQETESWEPLVRRADIARAEAEADDELEELPDDWMPPAFPYPT